MTCNLNRNEVITQIKKSLKRRSGKNWSVTGGRGTSYGWITIDAPPSRRTFINTPKQHNVVAMLPGLENWEEIDTGKSGGHTGPADRAELARLLGLKTVHCQGESIPASSDYRQEYLDRAEGKQPSVFGKPYWD